jgi:hypothetical protein
VFELNAAQTVEDVQRAVLGRAPVVAIGGISHDHSGFGVGPLLDVEYIRKRIREVTRTPVQSSQSSVACMPGAAILLMNKEECTSKSAD